MTIRDGAIAVRDEECRSSSDRALDGILIRGAIAVRDEECRSSSDWALDGILIRGAIEPKAHRAKRDREVCQKHSNQLRLTDSLFC
jgi:hypothetical protein